MTYNIFQCFHLQIFFQDFSSMFWGKCTLFNSCMCCCTWVLVYTYLWDFLFDVLGDLFCKAGLFFILMFSRKHEQKHIFSLLKIIHRNCFHINLKKNFIKLTYLFYQWYRGLCILKHLSWCFLVWSHQKYAKLNQQIRDPVSEVIVRQVHFWFLLINFFLLYLNFSFLVPSLGILYVLFLNS